MSRLLRVFIILPILALLFTACDTGEGMDLRLFCQRYSETASRARLEPKQFSVRELDQGQRYEAYLSDTMLLTLETQTGGCVHTISLTALPEVSARDFRCAAVDIIKIYCGAAEKEAQRWLNSVKAGETEILGYQTQAFDGFRLSYAANAAGCYLRVSQLRFLPEELELPTLKDFIEDGNDDEA